MWFKYGMVQARTSKSPGQKETNNAHSRLFVGLAGLPAGENPPTEGLPAIKRLLSVASRSNSRSYHNADALVGIEADDVAGSHDDDGG